MKITTMCERLHCLPEAGGLFDQGTLTVARMHHVLLAADEETKAEQKRAESQARLKQAAG